jgi:DNA invertase Pin-like site-specific DNA recombinase
VPTGYSYIRMSTDAQLKGHSLRRQTEQTEKYASEHGITLDLEFDLRDIGVSAFDGSNIDKGQLGKFLQAVKEGRIEKGSVLIIESLDRLSRQAVARSLRIFLDILEHGIEIVTLIDGRAYVPGNTDVTELMASLFVMSRANEESLTKQNRGRAVNEHKREKARLGVEIFSKKCPGWLRASDDRKKFEEIPDRVAVVRKIFSYADAGCGADLIARKLNSDRAQPFGKSAGWQKSSVRKILNNRAVLGEHQHMTIDRGKREPTGDPDPSYFPAIIDEATFYRVQDGQARRRIKSSGRKGLTYRNLFSGIIVCGTCGGPMHLRNGGSKGGARLVCSNAVRDNGCTIRTRWSYGDFETSVLAFVHEADLPRVVAELRPRLEQQSLDAQVRELEGRLLKARRDRNRIFELILGDELTDFLQLRLRESDRQVAELEKALDEIRQTLENQRAEQRDFETAGAAIADLVSQLQTGSSAEILNIRAATATRFRSIVKRIRIWPEGLPMHQDAARMLIESDGERARAYLRSLPLPSKAEHFFSVELMDGTIRAVSPAEGEPKKLRWIQEAKLPPEPADMIPCMASYRSA